jgi:Uri superfamily endonuclease
MARSVPKPRHTQIKPPLPLEKLLSEIAQGPLLQADEIDNLLPDKGAYLLIIDLTKTFDLEITTLPATLMQTGFYIYSGSARGPGGIKARLKRHFARDKRRHWHIDHLTLASTKIGALAIADGDECNLVGQLRKSRHFSTPVSGFGASDCRTCQSHLLLWDKGNTADK